MVLTFLCFSADQVSSTLKGVLSVGCLFDKLMSFLSIEDMNSFVHTNKSMHETDHLSVAQIVRSAMLEGKAKLKNSVEKLNSLVLHKAIYMPSTHRLLLVLTAKRCERCENKLRRLSEFGIAVCSWCRISLGDPVTSAMGKSLSKPVEFNDVMFDSRIAYAVSKPIRETHNPHSPLHERKFILKKPAFDAKDRRIGPCFTIKDLNYMTELPNYESAMTEFDKLEMKPSINSDELTQTVSEFRALSVARIKERIFLRRQRQMECRKNKLSNVVKSLHRVMALLPNEMRQFVRSQYDVDKHFALREPPNFYPDDDAFGVYCVHFRRVWLQDIFEDLLRRPSSYKTKLQCFHLAQEVCEHYGIRLEN